MKTKLLKEIEDHSAKIEGLLKNFKSKGTSALKELSENELKAVVNWSKEVIRQYTNLIDNDLSNIKDIADLPYPKERIKLAIKMMLPIFIPNGPQSMIKKLKLAYQELGSFQQIDTCDYGRIMSPESSKDAKSSKKIHKSLNIYNKYLEITISERKILSQEIENYVNDLKYRIKNEN
jgi:hypothetical protein